MRLIIMLQNTEFATTLKERLQTAGFGADIFANLAEATEAVVANNYDLILLGEQLDDGETKTWWRHRNRNRRITSDAFVILMTDHEEERIAALEAGADDSIGYDIDPRELIARVRAVLRRPRELMIEQHEFSDITLCTCTREVHVAGCPLSLQKRETAILESLIRRRGRVVPRAGLEHDVYGAQAEYCPNSLEVRVSRIRRQLAQAGSAVTIETVRGVGYRLAVRIAEGCVDSELRQAATLKARRMANNFVHSGAMSARERATFSG